MWRTQAEDANRVFAGTLQEQGSVHAFEPVEQQNVLPMFQARQASGTVGVQYNLARWPVVLDVIRAVVQGFVRGFEVANESESREHRFEAQFWVR